MKSAKWWMGLCVAGCMCASVGASAALPRASESSGGVEWTFSIGDNGAIVTGASPATGALTVPSTLGGQPVVEIGYAAFASCEELTTVTIPAGVKSIANLAFQYCSLLEQVSIPACVTNIGTMAFQYCESLPALALPQGLESIGTNACYHCTGMQKLYVPLAWWGTSKASAAGADCTVVYGEPGVETVLFDANSGSCGTASRSYAVGQAYGWLPEATHTYYAFTGWWTAVNGGTLLTATNLASVEGRRVLYAQWTPRTFQVVTFDSTGGVCDTTNRTYDFDSTYSPLPQPTREHYAFDGWWTSSYGGANITEDSAVSTNAALTLYAHWTRSEQVVTFNANGGVCDTTNRIYGFGSTYSPLPHPTREHYAFDGWWTSYYGGTNITEESSVTTNATRTLYAHWTPTEQVVTFNANGGVCDTTNQAFEIGKTYKPLPKATREGYVFDGWFTDYSGGDRISAATTVTESETRTLYAHWTLVEQQVTFDATGGTCPTASHAYSIGGTYGWFPEPTRDECVFIGWQTSDGEEVLDTSVVPEQRFLTLQARWLQYSLVNEEARLIRMIPTNALGAVVIPAECQGYPITYIGTNAFDGCSGLTGVTIPDSVTSIGINAFTGCTPTLFDTNAIPGVCLVDGWAVGNSGLLNGALDLTGVRGIADNAFYGCTNLTSSTIPDSVMNIGSNAFYGCSNLTSVTIGDCVTSIGNSAFYGCSGLTAVHIHDLTAWCEIKFGSGVANPLYYAHHLYLDGEKVVNLTIPDSVTSIGGYAFSGCSTLSSVTLGDSVTSIGNSAFSRCSGLTSVTIPDSVTSIGGDAFAYCDGLTSVTILGAITNDWDIYPSPFPGSESLNCSSPFDGCWNISMLVLGGKMTKIGNYMFYSCSSLKNVTIGDSVTSIGNSAFAGCSGLTAVHIHDLAAWCKITFGNGVANPLYFANHLYLDGEEVVDLTIPDSVTNIASYAFSYCSGLTSVTIPGSVTSIKSSAFSGCSGLTSVTIPDSVTSISGHAFYGCSGLTAVRIHDLAAWCGIEFGNSYANPLTYAHHLYLDGEEVVDLTIPDSVTSVGNYAFDACSSLTDLTIPDSVTSIGQYAFANCSGLTSVTIGDSVTSIGESAFYKCTNLTSVTIPDSVTSIGSCAFESCSGLASVTIPDSVTSIGSSAFYNCSGLKTLYAPESWKTKYVGGKFWSNWAGVPSGCKIIYYTPPKTSTGVPYVWLEEQGLGDGTAEGYEAAAAADAANVAYKVWECYVAGLDPADPAARFTAEIGFTNGTPVVSWTPDLNENGAKAARSYEVEGRATMTNAWGATNAASRFFRVKVALPQR